MFDGFSSNKVPRGALFAPPPEAGILPAPAPVYDRPQIPPASTISPPPPMPTPPPAKTRTPNIWDKDHISETLAGIGQAFLSHQNFSDGLGAVAGVLGNGQRQLREDAKQTTTYGGPNDQFAITTDRLGNRSIKEVPEFAAAVKADRAAKVAPTPAQANDYRARAAYSISQLPADQRPAAFQQLLANPQQYGVDASALPAEWSDQYGAVAGNMGQTVNQSANHGDREAAAADRRDANAWRKQQGAARVAQGAARVRQGNERLRRSPPSTRNGNADISYLR